MDTTGCSTANALWRSVLFIADFFMCLILVGIAGLFLSGFETTPFTRIALAVLSAFEGSSSKGAYLQYVSFLIGPLWVYNRYLARRTSSASMSIWPIGLLNTSFLTSIAVAAAVVMMIASMLAVSVWAGLAFFLGFALSAGAGASLRARMTGMLAPKHQLLAALLSAIAILAGSWLSYDANVFYEGVAVYGGVAAPILGIIGGFFMRLKPEEWK